MTTNDDNASKYTNSDGKTLVNAHIEFSGRDIEVKMPTEAQLAVMQRFANRYAHGDSKNVSVERSVRLHNAIIGICVSVMISQDDQDWLELAILNGELDIKTAAGIVTKAIDAVTTANGIKPANRAERRTRKPSTKAALIQ